MEIKAVPLSVTVHLTREEVGVLLCVLGSVTGPPSDACSTVSALYNQLYDLGFEMSGGIYVAGEITIQELYAQKTKSTGSVG